VYKIDIEPLEEKPNKTSELLQTMLNVMEAIEQMDDAGFVLRMKLLNNIEFLVDQLMQEYEQKTDREEAIKNHFYSTNLTRADFERENWQLYGYKDVKNFHKALTRMDISVLKRSEHFKKIGQLLQ